MVVRRAHDTVTDLHCITPLHLLAIAADRQISVPVATRRTLDGDVHTSFGFGSFLLAERFTLVDRLAFALLRTTHLRRRSAAFDKCSSR